MTVFTTEAKQATEALRALFPETPLQRNDALLERLAALDESMQHLSTH